MTSELGLAGGYGGKAFSGQSIPDGVRITEIHVYAEQYIDAIQVQYAHADGSTHLLDRVGGSNGTLHVFEVDADEKLVGISGNAGWYVDSIRFHTTKRVSETFGGGGGDYDYSYSAPEGGEVAGFFGRADWYLDAIGIITRTPPAPPAPKKKKKKVKPDDLKLVNGIGPKLDGILKENGVLTLVMLSQTATERLQEIIAIAGKRYAICDPTTWAEQASLIADGDVDGAKAVFTTYNESRTDS